MTCQQAIEFLYSRLKFGSVPGLERIYALCERLGNPQDKLKFIHVAGTNGKGSVCHMLSRMFIHAGYKTGLFTSPYVIDFRERMQINGSMIPESELALLMEEVKPHVEYLDSVGITPTEFEVLTALAFLYYFRNGCDVVVLEVGLGGLCDSTNVINDTDVCVITSLSFDHTHILGNTIEEIAFQKSGIIKQGSAVALYPQIYEKAAEIVEDTASEKGCTLFKADKEQLVPVKSDFSGCEFVYKNIPLKTKLIGSHQMLNAITAFEAAKAAQSKGYNLTDDDIIYGIANASVPARTQIYSADPLIVIDGSHNVDGLTALRENLLSVFGSYKISAVIGMMKDKDVNDSVKLIAPLCDRMTAVTVKNDRSMTCTEMKEILSHYCGNVSECEDSAEAFRKAKSELKEGEMLLVCGSLYLASEIENI